MYFLWFHALAELNRDHSHGCCHWQSLEGLRWPHSCRGPWCCLLAWSLSSFSSLDWTSIGGSGGIPGRPRWKWRLLNLQSVLSPTLNCAKRVINPVQVRGETAGPISSKTAIQSIVAIIFHLSQIITNFQFNHWVYFLMLIFTYSGAKSCWFGGI